MLLANRISEVVSTLRKDDLALKDLVDDAEPLNSPSNDERALEFVAPEL